MRAKIERRWAALTGLVSAGAGLAIAEATAVLIAAQSSPVLAIGSLTIDLAPPGVKDAVIALFGTGDKVFFVALLLAVLAVVAATAGLIERYRPPWGVMIFIALGVVAGVAVTTRSQSTWMWAAPTVIGMLGASLLLRASIRRLRDWTSPAAHDDAERDDAERDDADRADAAPTRRRFLALLLGAAAAAVVVGVGARVANAASLAADAVRAAISLPKPSRAAAPIPAASTLDIEGISPLITPNDQFYRIDTALQVPAVDPANWRLRVTGMVENEIEISFDELLALPLIETVVTLACVSNEVGGDLIGNAVWLGYPIRELLARAKPQEGADMVLSRSIDGFTASTPLEILLDENRDSILAVGMNGDPLPAVHGFPVRMVVPGLYGYVSATKWVTELRVTRFDQDRAYWTDRGWSEKGPIKIGSRIDVPGVRSNVTSGTVAVAGVAWAQHTGIASVEVRVDGGSWEPARLATPISSDTWVQWVYEWDAAAGQHELEVRATDQAGQTQSGTPVPVVPDGAEGWDTVTVTVT
ncbi:molybdopterin-dependent oxidoreductase [Microbacterium sp.]|uniref:molybdopterin-dependent oxidoreductase n=1 Tax=Microbacterium sp. TaxID=51671 RepID=UPI003F9B28EC